MRARFRCFSNCSSTRTRIRIPGRPGSSPISCASSPRGPWGGCGRSKRRRPSSRSCRRRIRRTPIWSLPPRRRWSGSATGPWRASSSSVPRRETSASGWLRPRPHRCSATAPCSPSPPPCPTAQCGTVPPCARSRSRSLASRRSATAPARQSPPSSRRSRCRSRPRSAAAAAVPALVRAATDPDLTARVAAIRALERLVGVPAARGDLKAAVEPLAGQLQAEQGRAQFLRVDEDLRRLQVRLARL